MDRQTDGLTKCNSCTQKCPNWDQKISSRHDIKLGPILLRYMNRYSCLCLPRRLTRRMGHLCCNQNVPNSFRAPAYRNNLLVGPGDQVTLVLQRMRMHSTTHTDINKVRSPGQSGLPRVHLRCPYVVNGPYNLICWSIVVESTIQEKMNCFASRHDSSSRPASCSGFILSTNSDNNKHF